MERRKNTYHPLFTILFIQELLPKEVAQQIPSSTRNDWNHKQLENYKGAEHCTIYTSQFNSLTKAHKYTYTRYTLTIMISILNTFIDIAENSLVYKKLLRTKANEIIQHITNLAQKGFSVKQACHIFGIKKSWYQYHKRKINCPMSKLRLCFKKNPQQLTSQEQNTIKKWIEKK